jgi:hypothetical protein
MNEEKISIVLEAVSNKVQQLDQATAKIDAATAASQRNLNVARQVARVQQDNVRVIDATTRATERATKATERQNRIVQQTGRPNASLASDPNAFFSKELAKQQADNAKAAEISNTKRAAALKKAADEEARLAGASERREAQLQNAKLRTANLEAQLEARRLAYNRAQEARARSQVRDQERINNQMNFGERAMYRLGLRALALGTIMRAIRFGIQQFGASLDRLELKPETAASALALTNNFREMRRTLQGGIDVLVNDMTPALNKVTGWAVKNKDAMLEALSPIFTARRLLTGRKASEEPAFAPPAKEFEAAKNLSKEMNVALLDATAKRTGREADIRRAALAAEAFDYEKRVQQINAVEVTGIEQRNALLEQAREQHLAKVATLEEEARLRLNKPSEFQKMSDEINFGILESRARRIEYEDKLRDVEIEREKQAYVERLEAIAALRMVDQQSELERRLLETEAFRAHQENLTAIEKEASRRRIGILQTQMQTVEGIFGNMAGSIQTFAGEGSVAYKAFATAQATMATAIGAIGAFTQASAAFPPPYGQIIGAVAAGAVVAFGAAQIAKINGAFAEGGVVPGAISHKDNRLAMVATGEVIISGRARQRLEREYGRGITQSLIAGALPGFGRSFASGGYVRPSSKVSFAEGGIVGPASAPRVGTNLSVSLVDARSRNDEREEAARDNATFIIDELNKRGNRLQA